MSGGRASADITVGPPAPAAAARFASGLAGAAIASPQAVTSATGSSPVLLIEGRLPHGEAQAKHRGPGSSLDKGDACIFGFHPRSDRVVFHPPSEDGEPLSDRGDRQRREVWRHRRGQCGTGPSLSTLPDCTSASSRASAGRSMLPPEKPPSS